MLLGCDDRDELEAWRAALVSALADVKAREAEIEELMYAVDPDSKVAEVVANPTFVLSGRTGSSAEMSAGIYAMGRYVREESSRFVDFIYRYILCESCSQFDSLPLIYVNF